MPNKTLTILHLFPELLNLYGDSGNIISLTKRLSWRGMDARVQEVKLGDKPDFSKADIVFIGGGSDREQEIVGEELVKYKKDLTAYVEDNGVLLAVCGAFQLLGNSYDLGRKKLEGVGLMDYYTKGASPRLIGNIVTRSPLFNMDIVGYENHAGRTYLSPSVEPLGKVEVGFGNDGSAKSPGEGARYKNVIATYIHGPLLPKNPQVADWLLSKALERKYNSSELDPLDDTVELEANLYMRNYAMQHPSY